MGRGVSRKVGGWEGVSGRRGVSREGGGAGICKQGYSRAQVDETLGDTSVGC